MATDAGTRMAPSALAPRAARVSMAGTGLFLVLLALLHALRADLDPTWTVISEYALGKHGWVMTVAFLSLAAGCGGLIVGLWPRVKVLGRIGLVLLAACGAGLALAAIFSMDPLTATASEATLSGKLHSLGAGLGGNIPIAALLVTWSMSRDAAWSPHRTSLWLAAAVAWIGQIALVTSMAVMLPRNEGKLGPEVLIGWPNRLMMLGYCIWLLTVAWHAAGVPQETRE